jgi:hypothetical protein
MMGIVSNSINAFKMTCPRCRKGKIFKNSISLGLEKNLAMHQHCSVCHQPTEIEVGFYVGTGYVSYALGVALTVATLVAFIVLVGAGEDLQRLPYWFFGNTALLLLIQPWMMRFSRSLWLSWFVKHEPDWQTRPLEKNERIIESQLEGKQNIKQDVLQP